MSALVSILFVRGTSSNCMVFLWSPFKTKRCMQETPEWTAGERVPTNPNTGLLQVPAMFGAFFERPGFAWSIFLFQPGVATVGIRCKGYPQNRPTRVGPRSPSCPASMLRASKTCGSQVSVCVSSREPFSKLMALLPQIAMELREGGPPTNETQVSAWLGGSYL